MLVPHQLNPPISGISYTPPPYLGYWFPLAITINTPFPGFLGPKIPPPPSRENGNTHAAATCIRVGAGSWPWNWDSTMYNTGLANVSVCT